MAIRTRAMWIVSFLLLFGAMCVMENSALDSRPETPQVAKTSAVYALAGEFRVVFANLLWIKADKYHHEFIHQNPDWTQDSDLLGMLRMITALDPTFTEAYASGVYMYADGQKDIIAAQDYLLEGLSNNPKSADLNRTAAIFYARRLEDPRTALVYARRAQKYTTDEFDSQVVGKLIRTLEEQIAEK